METERIAAARMMAERLHAGQRRKGTDTPYVTHPIAVAEIVRVNGGTEAERIAALLHDVVEDCGGAPVLEEVRRCFGGEVAEIVAGCTDNGEADYYARKIAYVRHLNHASPSVRLVATADKLHNAHAILEDLKAIGPKVFERFNAGREGVLWYYAALARALKSAGTLGVLLDLTVEELLKEAERYGE